MQQAANDPAPWHYSVLLKESLEYLAIRPDGIYVDVTAGLGGHAGAIAEQLTGLADCQRPGRRIARNGAPEYGRVGGADSLFSRSFLEVAAGARKLWRF